jgi:hypothetical protein
MNANDATYIGSAHPNIIRSSMNVDDSFGGGEMAGVGGGRIGALIGTMMNADERRQQRHRVTSSLPVDVHGDVGVDRDDGFVVDNDNGENCGGENVTSVTQYVDHSYTDYSSIDDEQLRRIDEDPSLLYDLIAGGGRHGGMGSNDENYSDASMALIRLREMGCAYGPLKRKNAGGVAQPFPGKVSFKVLVRVFDIS